MNIIEDHGDEVTEDCIDLIILDIPGGREYCCNQNIVIHNFVAFYHLI
jgi:hypothetical protein